MTAPGERDLGRLLAGLDPVRRPGTYLYVTLRGPAPAGIAPVLAFAEAEGVTLVLEAGEARAARLTGAFPSAWITLRVPSSLEAVGLLAAVTTRLAAAGIPCNAVSAYHHDHLFAPEDRADEALALLALLAGPGGGAVGGTSGST